MALRRRRHPALYRRVQPAIPGEGDIISSHRDMCPRQTAADPFEVLDRHRVRRAAVQRLDKGFRAVHPPSLGTELVRAQFAMPARPADVLRIFDQMNRLQDIAAQRSLNR